MVGPLSGAYTGQRAAFERACQAIGRSRLVDSTITGISSLLAYWGQIIAAVGARSTSCVYFTSSRSTKGFLIRDFPLLMLARLFKKRVINHLHGSDFEAFYIGSGRWLRMLVRLSYRAIDISCGPCSVILAAYTRFEHMRCVVVPNFFDPILFEERAAAREDSIRVLYFSNFIESKGFRVAVEAVKILRDRGHDAHITLCGTIIGSENAGATRGYLATIAREPFVTVIFGAFGEEKAALLFGSRFFVLPTEYPTEAVPITMIEALAAGCYVVSTDHGGIAEALNGFRCRIAPATSQDVAMALEQAIFDGDPDGVRRHNRGLALQCYSPERFDDAIRTLCTRYDWYSAHYRDPQL